MEIKETKVTAVDLRSGFVLKQTTTDKGEFLNRKLAVPHTIYVCEKRRLKLNKPIMNLQIRFN